MNKRIVVIEFPTIREAQVKAAVIDMCLQLSCEEDSFYKSLRKRAAAGIA